VRLAKIEEEYKDRVSIRYQSFILRPQEDPDASFDEYLLRHWKGAQAQEEGARFVLWEKGARFPSSSMKALEAAKAVEAQGEELFLRYHFALLKALFEDNLDISEPGILLDLATEIGADRDRVSEDLRAGYYRRVVWAEHNRAVRQFGIHSVPTVVLGEKELVVGAVSREVYRKAIDRLLAEEGKRCSS